MMNSDDDVYQWSEFEIDNEDDFRDNKSEEEDKQWEYIYKYDSVTGWMKRAAQ